MKLPVGYYLNRDRYKRQRMYFKHLYCFSRFLFMILLLNAPMAEAREKDGFCWDMNYTNHCDLEFNDGDDYRDDHWFDVDFSGELELISAPFRFRSDCEGTSSDCGKGRDWDIEFVEFYYTLDGQLANAPYELQVKFDMADGQGQPFERWKIGDKENGNEKGLINGMSGDVNLKFKLTETQVKNLEPGVHRFVFVIRGGNTKDDVSRRIHYPFVFDGFKQKQVGIYNLQPVELGTFPTHESFHEQDLCVFASRDGEFGLTATSSTVGEFALTSGNNGIQYKPSFAQKNNPNGIFELEHGKKYIADEFGLPLTGSPHEGCLGTNNMKLFIEVTDSFAEISTKPAGNYVDTLTLTVSVE